MSDIEIEENTFKEHFKYYKSKKPPPNLIDVVDFYNKRNSAHQMRPVNLFKTNNENAYYGLKPPTEWNAYELVERPGFIFITNPFTQIGQRYWSVRCMKDYARKPHKTNINIQKISCQDTWWEACQYNESLFEKMRWVTFGYQHNWDTKVYTENRKSEFPKDLETLSRYIARILGFPSFKPEAGIVNFYPQNATLSGHVDYSEYNSNAPIISVSFGQTAIFLLGGKTTDIEPIAMFIRSGDIVVMSKESRFCYHAVPKILQIDSRFWGNFDGRDGNLCKDYKDVLEICSVEELWRPFGRYLESFRINVNIRQVLNAGQKRLEDDTFDR